MGKGLKIRWGFASPDLFNILSRVFLPKFSRATADKEYVVHWEASKPWLEQFLLAG